MTKRIAISCLLILCVLLACSCELVKSPEYYELNGNDTVASFTKVVGDRKVNTTKIEMTNAVQRISYSYKDVENALEDAETYIDYLSGEEDFYYSGMLNLDEIEDEITLSKTSPNDKEYQIRAIVRYNVNTKIVKVVIEREKVIG